MDTIELITQCRSLGAHFIIENGALHVTAPKPLPDNLRAEVREQKSQIILCLNAARPSVCSNPFTPHETHEYPWECDPNTCHCFREYGYPRLCQGVPCRWVFPDKNKINGINADGGKTN